MSVVFGIAVYFMIWWIVLFAVLPFGFKRSQVEAGEVLPGSEPGAPEKPHFKKIFVITTIVASIVFASYLGVRNSGLTLDDLPIPGPKTYRTEG
ncbi:putative secreted protein [Roseibium hamelinense]|uniref:Putative secreted protein n=1 Tax=Roseibium hamelinense TaxID=150831 RepID=A0A562TGZ5_9HYPH|nr:DUF1467 family protein [Roseibium hamelinense]MTI45979.1 DUF1467 family protein [Roseibium hamelinense]TWI92832.1 putative secreted protein [Roseibium hamelinense]